MYYENANKTINFWNEGDHLKIFITARSKKKYEQFSKTIRFVKGLLGLNFDYEYDGIEIYFILADFNEFNEFKEYFYRYLCKFTEEK